ncbi:ABC transporter ATP-binding protein [Massilia sp. TWP1-3-3]|uniref:ABC transporter ATP-binding protein n=1 Tax=Massilia sp. TWP1-3-3 TaxID=2804573 RepID=UPI003CF09F67
MISHVIQMSGVCKAFGKHQVIDGLSLAVPEHSIFAFLGNNGEGKSTVIRMITGLLRADRGDIDVLGMDVRTERRAILSQIGAIVDAPSLYPNLNADEFLRIGCIIKDLAPTEVGRVLELVKLEKTRGRLIGKFSLGMKQRLAIAHALLGSPRLLIMDEPTNGLDPEGTLDIRTLLKSLPAVNGTSIFISSHNLAEIEKTATHVALLKGGTVRFQAPIDDLLAQQTGALAIDVGDIARAHQLLSGAAYQVERTEGGQLRVSGVERHHADRVHALLVHAGIRLYQSVYHTPSLEQWFLGEHHVS